MKASELIRQLENLKAAHGDLEVGIFQGEFCSHDSCTRIGLVKADHSTWGDTDDLGEHFFGVR